MMRKAIMCGEREDHGGDTMVSVTTKQTTFGASWASHAAVAGLLPMMLLAGGCNKTHGADVVATVNGHAIMHADMDRLYMSQLGDAQGQQLPVEQADSLRLNVVSELIDEEIVEQSATKMNLTATNEEVDAKVTEMKAPFTEEQFAAQLKASSRTLDDVKHDLRRKLTIQKLLNKEVNSKVTVSDADVTDYYNQHKADFNLVENKYHLAQILVSGTPAPPPGNLQGSKATSDAEAKSKIQMLKGRLDGGVDFGVLAANYSEDPQTVSSGGDMGLLSETQLKSNPTVYAAVMKLKAKQYSEIIPFPDPQNEKHVGGYAIFELIEKLPAGQRDLNDPTVQQSIRQQLREGREQLLKNAYLEMLHNQAKVENFFAEEIFKNNAK
jgi:peptidyl-prolyl cis-trans isomerase SurA